MRRPALTVLCAAMLLSTTGCFEQEEPTCAYWVPKLESPAKGEKAWDQVEELKCADAIPALEKMFDEELETTQVDIQKFLVIAATKLFFKRAPEMQKILSRIFGYVLKQSPDADLRQRVMLYYKLMQHDVRTAEQVICSAITSET